MREHRGRTRKAVNVPIPEEMSVAVFSASTPAALREAVESLTWQGDPRLDGAEQHLYVVEIPGVGVKVGITENLAQRLTTHMRSARSHGRDVGRFLVTGPHQNARDNESHLKGLGGGKSEYLPISFDTATDAVRSLPGQRADREAVLAERDHTLALFQAIVLGLGGEK